MAFIANTSAAVQKTNVTKVRDRVFSVPGIIGIVLVLLGLFVLTKMLQKGYERTKVEGEEQAPRAKAVSTYETKLIELYNNGWSAPISIDRGMRIDHHLLTKNVIWLVRYDKDPKRIRRMLPDNWSKTHVEDTFSVVEYMIDPNQSVGGILINNPPLTQGTLRYKIHPMSEGPCF